MFFNIQHTLQERYMLISVQAFHFVLRGENGFQAFWLLDLVNCEGLKRTLNEPAFSLSFV